MTKEFSSTDIIQKILPSKEEHSHTSFLIHKGLFIFLIFIEATFLLFQTCYQTLQGDENEHLYNAYMIFLGFSPYLDFFEHHNPLMWYITAPLYFVYENNPDIYYIVRILMFICVLITGFFTYKIAKKLDLPEYYCLFSVCIYFGFDILKLTGIQFRPDTPMALFTTMGLYYLISYLSDKKYKDILFSLTSFAASFWLLQKSLAFMVPLAAFFILLILLKKIQIKTILSASAIALTLSLVYLFYLYQTNALELYYTYNYLGNIETAQNYDFYKNNSFAFTYKNRTILFCILATILSFIINIKRHKSIALLACYTTSAFLIIVHLIYSTDKHYMLPLLPLFAIILADLLKKISLKPGIQTAILIIFIICQLPFDKTIIKENIRPLPDLIKINKFITENTTPDDEVITATSITGIKRQAEGYYYFGPQYVITTAHNLLPYKPLPIIQEIIINKKPKIIDSLAPANNDFANYIYQNYKTVCPIISHCFHVRKY